MPRTPVTYRIDNELLARVKISAHARGQTLTEWVAQAFEKNLDINRGDASTIHVQTLLESPMMDVLPRTSARPEPPVPPTPEYLEAKSHLKKAIRENPKPAGHVVLCRCPLCRTSNV